MIALCVDDEQMPLQALEKVVEESNKISEVHAFDDETDALEWAKTHAVDVAFLDIELHYMNGLELAEELLKINPLISIVFCTSYQQYAVKAIKMHVDAGYLMKPLKTEQVHDEIDHIADKKKRQKLTVRCFGDFEVFVGGIPLDMKRKRTKELLAYLIDRRGASVTASQILAALWGDEGIDNKKRDILYHLVADLKSALRYVGMDSVFVSSHTGYSINLDAVDCDYYNMLDGDEHAAKQYTGEYMSQYSWAEYTNSWLQSELEKR